MGRVTRTNPKSPSDMIEAIQIPNDGSRAPSGRVHPLVRLRLQDMAALAECAALDIWSGHGRTYVGPSQREKLAALGVPTGAAMLPLFGSRWPKSFEQWFAQKRTNFLRGFSKPNKEIADKGA